MIKKSKISKFNKYLLKQDENYIISTTLLFLLYRYSKHENINKQYTKHFDEFYDWWISNYYNESIPFPSIPFYLKVIKQSFKDWRKGNGLA